MWLSIAHKKSATFISHQMYLHELQDKLYDHFGVTISVSTICKTLRLMGF